MWMKAPSYIFLHRDQSPLSLVSLACKRRSVSLILATLTYNVHLLGGRCQIMFVIIPGDGLLKSIIISQIIRAGLRTPIASLHKLGCQKMLVKPIKTMPKIRTSLHVLAVTNNNWTCTDSPIAGLMMAIKDPIVLLFALMTICQILGLSFSNFFPTWVSNSSIYSFSWPPTLQIDTDSWFWYHS